MAGTTKGYTVRRVGRRAAGVAGERPAIRGRACHAFLDCSCWSRRQIGVRPGRGFSRCRVRSRTGRLHPRLEWRWSPTPSTESRSPIPTAGSRTRTAPRRGPGWTPRTNTRGRWCPIGNSRPGSPPALPSSWKSRRSRPRGQRANTSSSRCAGPASPQARIYRREKSDEDTGARPDPDGEYELLLDAGELGFDEFASIDILDISPDGSLLLYRIRDGGLDEISVRLFDLETLEERPDRLPEALYGTVAFDGDGEGFYYVHRSREDGPRARHHRIGTEVSEDREIFGEGYGPETFLRLEEIEDGRLLLLGVQHGWMRNDIFVMDRRRGQAYPVLEGGRAHATARYEEGRLLLTTNLDAPNYRVVAIPTEGVDPYRWSDRSRWTTWIPEQDHLLRGLHDDRGTNLRGPAGQRQFPHPGVRSGRGGRCAASTGGRGPPTRVPHRQPGQAGARTGRCSPLTSFTVPQTRYRLDLETYERELIEPPRPEYDGTDVLVEQVSYTSKDGTEAPMYIMRPRGAEPDGNLPTLLHGYGGFNSSLTPSFRAQAAVWVEAGGVFAVATLRGGGEFGENWHRGGMLENKQNVFDDFISAAEWLIGNGYTNPDRLAIMGGSNGGLLVASSFTQRPELYRAVYCGFPDLDMVRFYTFTHANNMPALLEYGNAGIPEQFEFLRQYSPYQAVEDGTDYPAVMFTQGDLDTRVPPLQARKMAARVQAASSSGLPVILRYRPRAGHAGGRSRVPDRAMDTAFLMMQLGMSYGEEPGS